MGKIDAFRNFTWRILKASKLRIELGSIQNAYKEELAFKLKEVQKYISDMDKIWASWKDLYHTEFNINQFIEDLGPTLLLFWLSEVFPFDFKQLKAQCPKGPSTEDVLMEIFYDFSTDELKIIKDTLIAHWINESEDQVAQLLFIEAVKSISDVFSRIISHPFKIFTSNVDLIKENNTLKIHYFGAGRVVR
jgi:hypothetical protein